jgi:hypothetical protein
MPDNEIKQEKFPIQKESFIFHEILQVQIYVWPFILVFILP